MTTRKTLLTAEQIAELPDDGRYYELVNGKLREVTPPNERHDEIAMQIGHILNTWAWQTRGDRVVGGPGFILERAPDTVRAPDVGYISRARQRPAGRVRGSRQATPDLIVEVASPDDTAREIAEKTSQWLTAGAQLVWSVYPDRETVEAFWADSRTHTYTAADMLDAEPVPPGFSTRVAELFALPDED